MGARRNTCKNPGKTWRHSLSHIFYLTKGSMPCDKWILFLPANHHQDIRLAFQGWRAESVRCIQTGCMRDADNNAIKSQDNNKLKLLVNPEFAVFSANQDMLLCLLNSKALATIFTAHWGVDSA